MRSLFIIFSFFSLSVAAGAGDQKPVESLPALIESALRNNPELKSSQARWKMYLGKAQQAGNLDDPMFMFKLQNVVARQPLTFGGADPQTAKVVSISQLLPFWGKRALKEDVAHYEAESYRWSLEERKIELRRMVTEVWYQLYSIDRALTVVDRNIRILSDFAAIAETRYAVGQGAQQDIFKAGLEKSKMLDMQISLRQQRTSLEANLNYLLFRSPGSTVGEIGEFELPRLALSPETLKETAFERRPQLKSLFMLASKGLAGHRLARAESYPDFNLTFEYMFREAAMGDPGYNMYSLGVTFNLPFLQKEKRHAMQAEASSETDMAMEELNAAKNAIAYAIADNLARLERRKKLVELYSTGIIPQAEQSLESALIGYRVGKVDFLTLLDGRVSLFNYERELYDSKAEFMMALARLEATVGAELVPAEAAASESHPH